MSPVFYYTTSCILCKFFQMVIYIANPNLSFSHSLLHTLFLSFDHSRSRMLLHIYVYILLIYTESLVICLYILYFIHLRILPSARIFFYLDLLRVLCLIVSITIKYFSFDTKDTCCWSYKNLYSKQYFSNKSH